MHPLLRRAYCWLKGHQWEPLEDHALCTRCWAEFEFDTQEYVP